MRALWVVVLVLVGGEGCRHHRGVVVPNTPEGLECQRRCMPDQSMCRRNDDWCEKSQNKCLKTCLSSMLESGDDRRREVDQ